MRAGYSPLSPGVGCSLGSAGGSLVFGKVAFCGRDFNCRSSEQCRSCLRQSCGLRADDLLRERISTRYSYLNSLCGGHPEARSRSTATYLHGRGRGQPVVPLDGSHGGDASPLGHNGASVASLPRRASRRSSTVVSCSLTLSVTRVRPVVSVRDVPAGAQGCLI